MPPRRSVVMLASRGRERVREAGRQGEREGERARESVQEREGEGKKEGKRASWCWFLAAAAVLPLPRCRAAPLVAWRLIECILAVKTGFNKSLNPLRGGITPRELVRAG